MIFPQNLHSHTIFGDGVNSPEEMAAGAVKAGCASLGFSEHSPMPAPADPDGWSMKAERVGDFRTEILRLKDIFDGQLEIFLGLEQDMDSLEPVGKFDYLIGSVHGVWVGKEYISVDAGPGLFDQAVRDYFGGDCLAFAKAYYQRVAEVAAKTKCQIVGHFDLITKNNEACCRFDESAPSYYSASMEALEAVMERDVIFEINTGAMSRGYRTAPYPSPALLRAIQERGGRICITSDSHSADSIVYAFPLAAELAKSCGFQESWVLKKNGWHPVGLDAYLD